MAGDQVRGVATRECPVCHSQIQFEAAPPAEATEDPRAELGPFMERIENEKEALAALLPQLLHTCPGQYVAIVGGQVAAHSAIPKDLLSKLRVLDPTGERFFFVARVEPPQLQQPEDIALSSYE